MSIQGLGNGVAKKYGVKAPALIAIGVIALPALACAARIYQNRALFSIKAGIEEKGSSRFSFLLYILNPTGHYLQDHVSLFDLAIEKNDIALVQYLLKKGINPDQPHHNSSTPLFKAAEEGKVGIVKILLACKNVDPNRIGAYQTPMLVAIRKGEVETVKAFLACERVNPNLADNIKWTPLKCAFAYVLRDPANSAWIEIMNALLECKRVKFDHSNVNSKEVFQTAINHHFPETVKVLLKRDDIDLCCELYENLLWCAIKKNADPEIIKYLINDVRIDPNQADWQDKPPLWYAIHEKMYAIIEQLLKCTRVDPCLKFRAITPLKYAMQYNDEKLLDALMACEHLKISTYEELALRCYALGNDALTKRIEEKI